MRIGIDSRSLSTPCPAGVAEYTRELSRALFVEGNEHAYYTFSNAYRAGGGPSLFAAYPQVQEIKHAIPNKLLHAGIYFFNQPKLDRLLPDRIDYFLSPNLHFTALSAGVRQILTIHDLSFAFLPHCFSVRQRFWHRAVKPHRQIEQAYKIIVPSHNTKRDLLAWHPGVAADKIHVIYPGLSAVFAAALAGNSWQEAHVRTRYHLPDRFILCLATLEPRKHITGLIRAYADSGLYKQDCHLVIAGATGWKYAPVLSAIRATEGVQYIGYVAEADKPALMKLAALFAYPSLYEGFGLPVLEAMAVGTPVITSNRSSLGEVAGTAAYLVNPHNQTELARALSIMLNDARLADHYGAAGQELAAHFSWKRAAREFLELLD